MLPRAAKGLARCGLLLWLARVVASQGEGVNVSWKSRWRTGSASSSDFVADVIAVSVVAAQEGKRFC
eukprot:symbB.v1.2.037772.t1/scaffold5660.1/size24809/3